MASSVSLAERRQMRWWGWGDPEHAPALGVRTLGQLEQLLGSVSPPRAPVALESVALPTSTLAPRTAALFEELLGASGVSYDHEQRVLHAAGKGYPDLVRLRAGHPEGAPDAVLLAADHDQVTKVLEICCEHSVAVVPFGGGTSVVGGVAPLRGEHTAVVALDLSRMDQVLALDRDSLTVSVQAGMRVRALESWLSEQGLTLGHFPQSFEYVSVGGCVATRSVGQASSGFGGIERMVLGLRAATPVGQLELPAMPATAAGPSLRQIVIGSEGTLGVITEVSLRVRAVAGPETYEGVFFKRFSEGVRALRLLAQQGLAPSVGRLSDEAETRMSMALAGSGGPKDLISRGYLRMRGYNGGALAILGFQAERNGPGRRERALDLLRAEGGLAVGRSPGDAWAASRFSAPYLRDELLTHGVMVETVETATPWSNVQDLHEGVSSAIDRSLRSCGTQGLVMCHVSHLYETGSSLYFTFIAPQQAGSELEQWATVKRAASEAIVHGGGTITHHHAVGRDHARWMADEIGDQGVRALTALKRELDPKGIMNPGKLLPRAGLSSA